MDELLTDQQQAEIVRNWLRENGWMILAGLVLGLGGLFGFNQWRDSQTTQAEEASQLYQQLVEAVIDARPVRAAELEAQLVADYSGSPYTDQGRLAMARLHMDRNEPDEAAGYLQRLANDTRDDGVRMIANLRLARVRIQQQKYDDAINILSDVDENSAFAGHYHEVLGDAYYAKGQLDDARGEYEAALGTIQSETLNRALVQVKLDSLTVEPFVAQSFEDASLMQETFESADQRQDAPEAGAATPADPAE